MQQRSNQKLLKACLANDRTAQRELYETYRLPLFRLCLRYARDKPEAEDFLQEGFIKIFQDLKKYRGEGPLGAWMRRVVLNVALQQLRKRKVTVGLEDAPELYAATEDPFTEDEMPNPQAMIALLQQLPAGYRAVFNLFVIENYSHAEIANQLEISVGASKSQLYKAKVYLRKLARPVLARSGYTI